MGIVVMDSEGFANRLTRRGFRLQSSPGAGGEGMKVFGVKPGDSMGRDRFRFSESSWFNNSFGFSFSFRSFRSMLFSSFSSSWFSRPGNINAKN